MSNADNGWLEPATPKLLKAEQSIPLLEKSLGDFWAWAFSDVLMNATRGVLAEFIVGAALDALDKPRIEWAGHDIDYCRKDGKKRIEVKSTAAVQSWKQSRPSTLSFTGMGRTSNWDPDTGKETKEKKRWSDVYVFCVYDYPSNEIDDVLNVALWRFYVLPTPKVDEIFDAQQTMVLSRIEEHASAVSFSDLKSAIDAALDAAPDAAVDAAARTALGFVD